MTEKPPPTLKPMSTFDPGQPALLHDRVSDKMIPWLGDDKERWRKDAKPEGDGVIAWDGKMLDGWCEPLGG